VYCLTLVGLLALYDYNTPVTLPPDPPAVVVPEVEPGPYDITHQIPKKYLSYNEVVQRLKEWNEEAPEITEFGTYGKDRQGTDLCYLRIGTPGKPKVLIHSAIHGNERLGAACTLGTMGKLLWSYKRDEVLENADVAEANWIIKNRDIYFVPVFAPETYLRQRYLEGTDPNRNWPYPGSRSENRSTPILAMREFFLKHKFVAAMDGHTYGRIFFWPSIATHSDREKFRELGRAMGELANYDASSVGSYPAGYAIDWYYWKGAVSLITEFGSPSYGHGQPIEQIESETERVYRAYLYFLRNAPEIQLQGQDPPKRSCINAISGSRKLLILNNL